MPFYPAADCDVHPAAGVVACRCCPGGISRSTRARRYPSDMTEAEWAVCEPLLPAPAWLAGRGGRLASWCMRNIVDAIRYLTHNGPVWRALPADFPPAGTVYWWADKWQAPKLKLEIVRRPDDLHTFQVLPRRWIVERTLSWITRHRRTVRDYERLPAHHETYIYWAMIIIMTRRLARQPPPPSRQPPNQVELLVPGTASYPGGYSARSAAAGSVRRATTAGTAASRFPASMSAAAPTASSTTGTTVTG